MWPAPICRAFCDQCQAWLADILAGIANHKITDLGALLPWAWRGPRDPHRPSGLTLAAPDPASPIRRAAEILGEDEELLWDMAADMEPEHGWRIFDRGDQQTIVFTQNGIEYLREMLPEYKSNRSSPRS